MSRAIWGNQQTPSVHLRNGILLSLTFSIVEACLIGVLSLQTALASSLIYYATGLFYAAYVGGCLISPTIASHQYGLGVKNSLLCGLFLLVIYMLSQIYVNWYITLPGSIFGGIGCAIIWTSQGAYLTFTAVQHAQATGTSIKTSVGSFSGIFYSIFQFCVIIGQLFASSILSLHYADESVLRFLLYFLYSVVSIFGIFFGWIFLPQINSSYLCLSQTDFENNPKNKPTVDLLSSLSNKSIKETIYATINNCMDYRTYYMIPSNIVHGIMQNFQFDYFNKYVIGSTLGNEYIGLTGSLIALIAATAGYPIGKYSGQHGRLPYFLFGSLCNVLICIIIMFWSVSYNLIIITLLIVFLGCRNAVWGAINAAIVGDFFHEDPAPGYANIKMWSGASTAIGFFFFQHIDIRIPLCILIILSIISCITYIAARDRFQINHIKEISSSSSKDNLNTEMHDS